MRRLSLLSVMLIVTAFAVGLGIGLAVGDARGYSRGFSEGPIRLKPGDLPDNWTPPPAAIEQVKDR